MPDLIRPEHKITLGGESLPLRYEFCDWMAAEKRLNVAFYPWGQTEWWKRCDGEVGLSKIVDLAVVGVIHVRPDVTAEWVVSKLATPEDVNRVNTELTGAVTDFFIRVGLMKPTTPETIPNQEDGPTSGPSADTTSDSPSQTSSISPP